MSNDPRINSALWQYCLDAGAVPGENALPARTPEELAWLREAMESVEMPDKMIKRTLESLYKMDEKPSATNSSEEGEGKKPADDIPSEDALTESLIDALDELQEMVEDLNFAKEFQLMKGPEVVLLKLQGATPARNPEIRRLLLLVIAHASQNLEDLQDSFCKLEWAKELVPMLRAEKDASVRAACVLACSAICRGHAKASGAFVNAGGFSALEEIVQTLADEDPKSVSRSLNLASHFASVKVTSAGMIETCCALLSHEKENVVEPATVLLTAVVNSDPTAAQVVKTKADLTFSKWTSALDHDHQALSEEQMALLKAVGRV